MSRIGKQVVTAPGSVKMEVVSGTVKIKGPKGELTRSLPAGVEAALEEGALVVRRKNDSKKTRALHGLTRALLANDVKGVSEGFEKTLELSGVGYKVAHQGKKVQFNLGYSHPIEFPIPPDVEIEVDEKALLVTVKGMRKDRVGQVAAEIRKLRAPSPYSYRGKFMGVKYRQERLRLKQGKTGS